MFLVEKKGLSWLASTWLKRWDYPGWQVPDWKAVFILVGMYLNEKEGINFVGKCLNFTFVNSNYRTMELSFCLLYTSIMIKKIYHQYIYIQWNIYLLSYQQKSNYFHKTSNYYFRYCTRISNMNIKFGIVIL